MCESSFEIFFDEDSPLLLEMRMEPDHSCDRLIALPVQFIQLDDGGIIKRGGTEIRIPSKAAVEVLQTIFSSAANGVVSRCQLLDRFHEDERPAVEDLINKLVAHKLLISAKDYGYAPKEPESSLDIFYWHFGERASDVSDRINNCAIAILGVNAISRGLAASLLGSGINNVKVIDCPPLRNLRLLDDAGHLKQEEWPVSLPRPLEFDKWAEDIDSCDCLVATSDFGEQEVFRNLNNLSLTLNKQFLPVVLHNLQGYVGPLVVPGESPCFECFQARRNSHLEDLDMRKAIDSRAFEGQVFVGFHPIMASVVASIAAFEIIKFYGGPLVGYNVGTLIEVNLVKTQVVGRKVLKIPGCLACSRSMKISSMTPHKSVFSKAIDG